MNSTGLGGRSGPVGPVSAVTGRKPPDRYGGSPSGGPVTPPWTRSAGRLPAHHRDPFDRMLVAQAAVEGLTLVSRDESIARYDVDILKA